MFSRWSVLGPVVSPLFLPAFEFSVKSKFKLNVAAWALPLLSKNVYLRTIAPEVQHQPLQKETIPLTTFSTLPLSAALQQKLEAAQFINLTPIQEQAIPPALEGRDVIGTSQTGTGKTLAFLIPIIEMLQREPSHEARVLILLPTRELAMQVHEQYEALRGKSLHKPALVIGGVNEKSQIQHLRAGCFSPNANRVAPYRRWQWRCWRRHFR